MKPPYQWSEDLSPSEASAMMGSGGYERAAMAKEGRPRKHDEPMPRKNDIELMNAADRYDLLKSMPLTIRCGDETFALRRRMDRLVRRGLAKSWVHKTDRQRLRREYHYETTAQGREMLKKGRAR